MVKGAPSLNPFGRPRGARGLAAHAAAITDDGRTALDFLAEVMASPKAPLRERVQAALALLDRVGGKPMQAVQLDAQISHEHNAALAPAIGSLTPAHLAAVRKLLLGAHQTPDPTEVQVPALALLTGDVPD